MADMSIDTVTKGTLMRSSVEEFLAAIKVKWPDVEQELAKSLALAMSGQDQSTGEGEMDMATLKQMKDELAKLQKQVDEATAGDPVAKAEALAAENADLKKKLEDAEKVAKEAAEKKDPTNSMSQNEQTFHDGLNASDKKDFLSMNPAERKKKMSAKKDAGADETIEVAGQTVTKAAVGDTMFVILKAQAAEVVELKKDKEDLRKSYVAALEKAEMSEFSKRAEEDMGHLPGTVEEKAQALKAISALPEAAQAPMLKMLKAGDKAISGAFATIGTKNGGKDVSKGANDFTKRVAEVKKRDGLSETEAMSKARQEYPDEFAAYQEAN